jgi:glyoxylase-like metal-dependent hydrolase (beta-lactamase superfamily II)/rhodanese-related sulfurtransferase
MEIRTIRTPGLGDATYVLSHGGRALVVDPQRDVDRFLDGSAEVRYVLETHLHNDYVSGGRSLAARTGAELVLPAGSGAAFRHTPAFHLEDLGGGDLVVRPIHTPGHTPEHCSYLVLVEGEPVAVFSGGSLLVGSAGRPDLLGRARADSLARLQYRSIHRLAALPDGVGLYPTHGEGSFCTATGAGRATSTIGEERRTNPVLAYADEESFVAGQLAGLQPYPDYYASMGPINLMGPEPLPGRRPPELGPGDVEALPPRVAVVDARPRHRFAAGHIPGSLGVELRDDFGTWVGWLVPFGTPLALVLDGDGDLAEAVVQLARVGFDDVRGVLRGLDRWEEGGRRVQGFATTSLDGYLRAYDEGAQVLDVRSPGEWEAGHLEGSLHRYVPDLRAGLPVGLDPSRPVWVACGSGYRAAFAASLLERQGVEPVVLIDGGVPDLLARRATAAAGG